MLTPNEVSSRVVRIATLADYEDALRARHEFYRDVLQAIANGTLRHRELARIAVTLDELPLPIRRATESSVV